MNDSRTVYNLLSNGHTPEQSLRQDMLVHNSQQKSLRFDSWQEVAASAIVVCPLVVLHI
jgi:hypothetical protein